MCSWTRKILSNSSEYDLCIEYSVLLTPMRHHRPSRLQKRHKFLASLRVSPVDSAATNRKKAAMTMCSTNKPQMATDILHKLFIHGHRLRLLYRIN